jgi:hypothetical protein
MAKTVLARIEPTLPARLADVVGEVPALEPEPEPERIIVDPSLIEAAARAWSANTVRAFLSDIRLWDG